MENVGSGLSNLRFRSFGFEMQDSSNFRFDSLSHTMPRSVASLSTHQKTLLWWLTYGQHLPQRSQSRRQGGGTGGVCIGAYRPDDGVASGGIGPDGGSYQLPVSGGMPPIWRRPLRQRNDQCPTAGRRSRQDAQARRLRTR